MLKSISAACVAIWFGQCLATLASAQEETVRPSSVSQAHLERERDALKAVVAKAQDGHSDSAAIIDSLKSIVSDQAFTSLSIDERRYAYLLLGGALYDEKRFQDARDPLEQATTMPNSGVLEWDSRLRNSFELSDYVDASKALAQIARRWPEKLSDYPDEAIGRVGLEVLSIPGATNQASELLNALYAAPWHPTDAFWSPDSLWLPLVRLRLEAGDPRGAREVAETLRDPLTFIGMHADKRFDQLVQAEPQRYDVTKAFAAELSTLKKKAAAAPDKLEGINEVARELLMLNRPSEALALVSGALARIAKTPHAFTDVDDFVNWTQDLRASALIALGRGEEGLAAMTAGAALNENGTINVSQAINLGDQYVAYDRPNDALAAVAALDFSRASPYGRVALEYVRACALFRLGNKTQLNQVLEFIKAHKTDGAQPYMHTMLCVGDYDAAAAEVIARLEDPARRLAVLVALQDYLPSPNPTKRDDELHAAWIAVRSRPDVATVIARVGRIESYAVGTQSY